MVNGSLRSTKNKKNLLPAFLVETRASKLTRLELGPKKLSGVFRICDAIVSGDAVVPDAPKTGLRPSNPDEETIISTLFTQMTQWTNLPVLASMDIHAS